jgi:hypothetical protein
VGTLSRREERSLSKGVRDDEPRMRRRANSWLLNTNVYGRFGQSTDWKFKISLPPSLREPSDKPSKAKTLIVWFSLKENQDSVLTSNAQNLRFSYVRRNETFIC